jgi:hypothetical protein
VDEDTKRAVIGLAAAVGLGLAFYAFVFLAFIL